MDGRDGQARSIVAASAAPFKVEIPLKSSWDAPLTYSVLDKPTPDPDAPVFVGREKLLGPLVSAIGQPGRGGTYLISGYRGVGKTSLIIEAARRAQTNLPDEWQLLPLVLNVSQVSASLESPSTSETGELQISARRLLTALLRALHSRVRQADADLVKKHADLVKKIDDAYAKAQATTFTATRLEREEATRTRTIESRWSLGLADVFKLLSVVALVLAGGVETLAWLRTSLSQAHVIAASLAVVAVVAFTRARSISRSVTSGSTSSEEFVTDNSLHQLESDLQDILEDLHGAKWRTVIVMEELDKIDDEEGRQLDSVIRYFKNLFTQAPAIFFFITDKKYFDLVEGRIDAARRRERSYAIEHTFFTHRVFIRRPGIEDCLQFLKDVTMSSSVRRRMDEIAKYDQRVRPLEDMDDLEQFVRLLLYRSQYHFFDLKTVMRQYVQVSAVGPYLRADDSVVSRSDRALASFQFLIEQKTRNHGFGGSDYANETLQNCLFAVFNDLYSAEPQNVQTFYPRENVDQLDLSQRQAIQKAVDELVDDLGLGHAAEVSTPMPGESGGTMLTGRRKPRCTSAPWRD
jgi:AAA ATPase domain